MTPGRKEVAEPSCLTELPQPLSCLPSEDQPFVVFLQRAVEGKEVVGVFLLSVFSNAQHPPPPNSDSQPGLLCPHAHHQTSPTRIPSPLLHTHFVSPLGIPAGLLLAEGCLLEGSPPSAWRQHRWPLSSAETSLAQRASHVRFRPTSPGRRRAPCQASLRRGTLCLGKSRGLS